MRSQRIGNAVVICLGDMPRVRIHAPNIALCDRSIPPGIGFENGRRRPHAEIPE